MIVIYIHDLPMVVVENYSEADRNERCQQAYNLFTDKE